MKKFLNLGYTPPADAFLAEELMNDPEVYFPLEVYICKDCGLIQLGYTVPPEILYQKDYPYDSSITQTGRKHFHSFARKVVQRYNLGPDDLAIDIGSNVGVLLAGFKEEGVRVLGVEPASNICELARKNGINTINDFLNEESVRKIIESEGKAKIITATNVFAHIDDLHTLMENIDNVMDEKGVFIIEAPYLLNLIDGLQYDTIYHEHLSYISAKPLNTLFDKYGMELIDIEEVTIHGGSLRYFVSRKGAYPVSNNVEKFVNLEIEKGVYEEESLNHFADLVWKNREELTWMLKSIKKEGKTIAGVSAPAKGMTLLNYCRIGPELLDFITEKSDLKIGKYTPGVHIPLMSDSELLKQMPDYALILAWNFADEIIENLDEYRKAGGKFIIPIPEPHIIE